MQNAYSFFFLFVVCSSINPKLLQIGDQMCAMVLFGDSPCWDSRRDKNKSLGMLEIRRRIMEGIQTVSEGGQKKCKVPWSFSIRQKEFRIKKSEVGHETVNKGFTFSNGTDFRQVWPDRLSEVRYCHNDREHQQRQMKWRRTPKPHGEGTLKVRPVRFKWI